MATVEIADISEELKHEDRFVWVGLYEPDEKLLGEIQEVAGPTGDPRGKDRAARDGGEARITEEAG